MKGLLDIKTGLPKKVVTVKSIMDQDKNRFTKVLKELNVFNPLAKVFVAR